MWRCDCGLYGLLPGVDPEAGVERGCEAADRQRQREAPRLRSWILPRQATPTRPRGPIRSPAAEHRARSPRCRLCFGLPRSFSTCIHAARGNARLAHAFRRNKPTDEAGPCAKPIASKGLTRKGRGPSVTSPSNFRRASQHSFLRILRLSLEFHEKAGCHLAATCPASVRPPGSLGWKRMLIAPIPANVPAPGPSAKPARSPSTKAPPARSSSAGASRTAASNSKPKCPKVSPQKRTSPTVPSETYPGMVNTTARFHNESTC